MVTETLSLMPEIYAYDVWDGKKVIGHFHSGSPIHGKFVAIPQTGKPWDIFIPIIWREIPGTPIERVFRVTLDVRRKSKRQIAIILTH